jgi:hypothetical protein
LDIIVRQNGLKWVVEVWSDNAPAKFGQPEPFAEEQYVEINQWCIDTFGYHARTAYHVFELRKKSHLDWFMLRWT